MSSRRDSADYDGVSVSPSVLLVIGEFIANHTSDKASFDDATEVQDSTIHNLSLSIPQSASTRSLTDSSPSGSGATPQFTEAPSSPPGSQDEKQKQKKDDDGNTYDLKSETQSEAEETPRKTKSPKSPLLTAHRLSTTSLDEVNLATNHLDDVALQNHDLGQEPLADAPPLPARNSTSSAANMSIQGLSGNLPPVPWGSPPVNKAPAPAAPTPAPAPPITRKLTGPFAWLSRSSTASREVKSPPPPTSRRNTAASVSTLSSNPEMAHRLQDGEDIDGSGTRRPRRGSLKDQFKLLRMRDEGLVSENDEASVTSGRASISHSAGSPPPSIPEEEEHVSPPLASPPNVPATINPSLPPGTVSGFSASASDASAPVDWELWQQLVNHGPQALKGANSEELNAAIKRGIPQTIRGVIWQILADSRNPELEEVYRELVVRGTDKEKQHLSNGTTNGLGERESLASSRSSVRSETSSSNHGSFPSPSQEIDSERLAKEQAANETVRKKKAKEDAAALQKLEKAIRRDLGARTSYSRYFVSQGNQESLFGLCKAYALYDEAVGYAQGMNFIVMPLLFNMDEAEAFTLMVKLMNKYGLREMFIHDMPGLHRSLYVFERLLEDWEPALYCHLRRRGVHPQLYATQWFLTLFAYRFPLQLVLRIYDLIFEEGLESAILKFAIAIMRRNAQTLLTMKDMTPLTTFLKERLFDIYIDKQPSPSSLLESGFFGSSGAADKEVYRADIMVQDACAITLAPETIRAYTAEWEEKERTEKEREAELDSLRNTVASQSARIRSLEEQAEASDKEHVQLASELVHIKVENEELTDINDALKLQVTELKIVVDKQPAEVEEKLRTEMDRIMKRNLEVQNENRSLSEQMADMERELVEAKMKWAEIHEEHENLKQKWSDLRKALD
ncbi:putative GTPase activating protein (Gyp5) [Aspergillus clavatus NRRL 1]|uniref:GTPase-activating protein GYP5 n=1 Tax=Aspergillus clavatus (strain ATCC 1007 / CBS 513.65 / DSM 816 / NCTC 3887 / NRRL 1 / QM 1276 / 107) TaxID=344612 RepID=A1CI02_ASPCL|nr:GTPase activating protein (Gyp5), putative [Aspergillus clavatus NRRL 1]EAW10507.1 GTPase activating protein (Gyp5), putative [Aspergillus clavatus NRRL 1]